MQAYTNRFNLAINRDGSEVILNFFQNMPSAETLIEHEDSSAELSTEMTPVANLVMTGRCAHSLLQALQNILGKADDTCAD